MDTLATLASALPEAGPSTRPASATPAYLQASTSADPISRGASQDEHSSVQSSIEDVWFLKEIPFYTSNEIRKYKIITQNFNGPCSFIAICNILILRDQIKIEPPGRTSVSYNYLSQLVAEHLLLSAPDVDISTALSIMPLTTKGMDLNPVFTGPTNFRPATTGGELDLFASTGIPLVHGWLVDPDSPEYTAVARAGDYDAAVNLIVEADVLTKGQLVQYDPVETELEPLAGPSSSGPSSSAMAPPVSGSSSRTRPPYAVGSLKDHEQQKVEDALYIQTFLDNTRSQLTYHGLFTLASLHLPPPPSADEHQPELFALFRNAHLSVLYKHPTGALYSLATDESFLYEPSVVWERLEDVDQGASVFVDGTFEKSVPFGGDWAGWSPAAAALSVVDPADQALAEQLQQEEDTNAQREYARRQAFRKRQDEQRQADEARVAKKERKKKGDCIIM